tara:strand:- start:662 stop:1168 length:507 start_codon:yes stop_codon:yes gene_type:complete
MAEASKHIVESITKWMETFVEKPHPSFGNMPPCPYARQFRLQNKVNIIECKTEIWNESKTQMDAWNDEWEAIILASEDTAVDHHLLSQKVAELNKEYKTKDLVALEDHPNSVELIDGVSMNHGHLVLVVIQRLQRLNQFSSNLQKTKYYDKWSEENLDDVVSWRFKDE